MLSDLICSAAVPVAAAAAPPKADPAPEPEGGFWSAVAATFSSDDYEDLRKNTAELEDEIEHILGDDYEDLRAGTAELETELETMLVGPGGFPALVQVWSLFHFTSLISLISQVEVSDSIFGPCLRTAVDFQHFMSKSVELKALRLLQTMMDAKLNSQRLGTDMKTGSQR